jgi:peptidoglycan/LPS O-acetylase OafA/YrhL
MDGLSVGVFLAATRPMWRGFTIGIRRIVAVGGTLALIGGLALLRHPSAGGVDSIGCYTLIAIGFGGLVVAFADLSVLPAARLPIEKIAIWSYGAYLWNNIAFPVLRSVALPWPLNFGGFALALIPAAITYNLIEEPFLKLRGLVLSLVQSKLPDRSAAPMLEKLPGEMSVQR